MVLYYVPIEFIPCSDGNGWYTGGGTYVNRESGIPMSLNECQDHCASTPDCKGYEVFDYPTSGHCYIFHEAELPHTANSDCDCWLRGRSLFVRLSCRSSYPLSCIRVWPGWHGGEWAFAVHTHRLYQLMLLQRALSRQRRMRCMAVRGRYNRQRLSNMLPAIDQRTRPGPNVQSRHTWYVHTKRI